VIPEKQNVSTRSGKLLWEGRHLGLEKGGTPHQQQF